MASPAPATTDRRMRADQAGVAGCRAPEASGGAGKLRLKMRSLRAVPAIVRAVGLAVLLAVAGSTALAQPAPPQPADKPADRLSERGAPVPAIPHDAGGMPGLGPTPDPVEYVYEMPPVYRRERPGPRGAGAFDLFLAAGRTRAGYHVMVRLPTAMTKAQLAGRGGYAVRVYSATETVLGRRTRELLVEVPENWPVGQKIELPGGPAAFRLFDDELGVLTVELHLPHGTFLTDKAGNPLLRIEVENRNPAAGREEVGSQVFPPPDQADRTGLGRFPAEPRKAAIGEVLAEFEAAVHNLPAGDPTDISNLLFRATLAKVALDAGNTPAARAEVEDLLDRVDLLIDRRRLPVEDGTGFHEQLGVLRDLLADLHREQLRDAGRDPALADRYREQIRDFPTIVPPQELAPEPAGPPAPGGPLPVPPGQVPSGRRGLPLPSQQSLTSQAAR